MTDQRNTGEYAIDIIHFFKLIFKWKWPIAIVCLIAALATYFFTGQAFITPRYKASVIFYPTTNTNISSTLLSEPGSIRVDMLEFGSDDEAEQILQILESDEIRNKTIDYFDIQHYYKVDTTKGKSYLTLRTMLNKNLKIKQTEYKAIQITVYDHDAQRAADIANYIAAEADRMKNAIQKIKAKTAYEIMKQEYLQQKYLMDSIDRNLMALRERGIYDFFEQSSQLNEMNASIMMRLQQEQAILKVYEENKNAIPDTTIIRSKARVKGYQAALESVKPKLDALKQYGGKYLENWNDLDLERRKLSTLKIRFESARLDYEKALPQNFVISPAEKPEIPSTPRRLMTTAIVTLSVFILSVILILITDSFQLFKRKSV